MSEIVQDLTPGNDSAFRPYRVFDNGAGRIERYEVKRVASLRRFTEYQLTGARFTDGVIQNAIDQVRAETGRFLTRNTFDQVGDLAITIEVRAETSGIDKAAGLDLRQLQHLADAGMREVLISVR